MSIKRIIYLDAGHSISDPGATSGAEIEGQHARNVRDLLIPLLRQHGFTVMVVPDNLNLGQTISWINSTAKKLEDGFAFAIHLNSNSGTPGVGSESWYCYGAPGAETTETAKKLVQTIQDKYAEISGFKNRGTFPDTSARFGRLGFVRDTKCYAGLIELCFINNHTEIERLKNNYQLIAEALCRGIRAAFGDKETKNMETIVNESILGDIYQQLLMRAPDEGAKGYLGMDEVEVRARIMTSEERKDVEAVVAAARKFKK